MTDAGFVIAAYAVIIGGLGLYTVTPLAPPGAAGASSTATTRRR